MNGRRLAEEAMDTAAADFAAPGETVVFLDYFRDVLGRFKAAEKSSGIVAIPALLDMLPIEGAIVTIEPGW
jgi:hypothetical protein